MRSQASTSEKITKVGSLNTQIVSAAHKRRINNEPEPIGRGALDGDDHHTVEHDQDGQQQTEGTGHPNIPSEIYENKKRKIFEIYRLNGWILINKWFSTDPPSS